MKVSELVEVLDVVKPTLASSGLVPIMEHFWFTGDKVVTFDDHLGMQAPCDIGLQLTIPNTLLPLLKASHQGGEVRFEPSDKEVAVFVGKRNKVRFPVSSIKDANMLFQMPKLTSNISGFYTKLAKVRRAIAVSRLVITDDPQYPERAGITVLQEDGGLAFYAFNNSSLTRCWLQVPTKVNARITVPTGFWKIFMALTGGNKEGRQVEVMLDSDKALAVVDGVHLFAKTLPVDQPTDVRKIYDTHFTDTTKRNLVTVTTDLVEAVERAAVLSKDDDQAKTKLTVKAGKLRFYTDSLKGEGDDVVPFDHPDTSELTVHAKPLLGALEEFNETSTKVALTKRVVVVSCADRVFILSGAG